MSTAKKAVIGIDLGGTFTKIGIVDRDGNVLALERFPSHADEPFETFLEELQQVYDQIVLNLPDNTQIIACGIGAPSTNCFTGEMENPSNFSWGEVVPLAKGVNGICNVPVHVNNDANVAALGEMKFGGGKGMQHLAVITLGTGLGGGFIINGRLHIGHNGMAGEIGHTNAVRGGRQCRCGLKGCIEQYVSVTGIRRTVEDLLMEKGRESLLQGQSFEEITGKEISEAALEDDAVALEAFEITGRMLGEKLADVIAYFNPEAIFLTGGLAKARHFILEPTRRHMLKNIFHIYKGRAKVMISELVNKEGAVLGAAALAWQRLEVK
ncbi:MAG: ROK family protein [Bacteroidota bacterium]